MRASLKSSSRPYKYSTLFGSITHLNPSYSSTMSSSVTSSCIEKRTEGGGYRPPSAVTIPLHRGAGYKDHTRTLEHEHSTGFPPARKPHILIRECCEDGHCSQLISVRYEGLHTARRRMGTSRTSRYKCSRTGGRVLASHASVDNSYQW